MVGEDTDQYLSWCEVANPVITFLDALQLGGLQSLIVYGTQDLPQEKIQAPAFVLSNRPTHRLAIGGLEKTLY